MNSRRVRGTSNIITEQIIPQFAKSVKGKTGINLKSLMYRTYVLPALIVKNFTNGSTMRIMRVAKQKKIMRVAKACGTGFRENWYQFTLDNPVLLCYTWLITKKEIKNVQ